MSRSAVLLALLAILGTGRGAVWAGINEWTSLGPEGGNISSLAIDPQHPSTLYAGIDAIAGTGAQVFKSTDGGGSWNATSSGLPTTPPPGPGSWRSVSALAVDPRNPSTVYAGIVSASTYAVIDAPSVFKSTDGGASWSAAGSGLPPAAVRGLAIDPQNPSTVYAGIGFAWRTDATVFKSTDGGASWNPANSGLPTSSYWGYWTYSSAASLAVDPQNPSIVYAGLYGGGLFKSTDSGTSWFAANTGLTAVSIVAVDSQNPSTVYAGTANYCGCENDPNPAGVWKSTDGGTNWSAVNSGLPVFPSGLYPNINSLVIDPLNPSIVYAGLYGRGVFKSTDSGTSWFAANTGLTAVSVVAVDSQNPSTVYAGTARGGVFAITFVPAVPLWQQAITAMKTAAGTDSLNFWQWAWYWQNLPAFDGAPAGFGLAGSISSSILEQIIADGGGDPFLNVSAEQWVLYFRQVPQ
jgi:hypothetical protein